MESQILFFSGVSIIGFFIVGFLVGWFTNDVVAAFLNRQRFPTHPEMYDENGNVIPDEIHAVRFENPELLEDEEE
tara:strand:+ start:1625 stop:1849 length:225 start_codon:yes stop_codon:yes gene_type:complete